MNILETEAITKSYKKKKVVNNVNLHVKQGEIYGFVGPNGAGKSTILKMLLNLVSPDSGSVKIFGKEVNNHTYKLLCDVGSIIEYPYFYTKLTGRENLELHCRYLKIPIRNQVNDMLDLLSLSEAADRIVDTYSVGMKQRLAIARAIISKPRLLILDEPLNGLDPEGIAEIRRLILNFKKQWNMSILISSHILSEMELIADTIGVIKEGILLSGTSIEEIHKKRGKYRKVDLSDTNKGSFILKTLLGIKNIDVINEHELHIYDLSVSGRKISRVLVENDIGVESIGICENSLEDYFFKIVSKGDSHD